MMEIFAILIFSCITVNNKSIGYNEFVNPNGTYKYGKKKTSKDGQIRGYFGEIRIKLIDSAKIAMSFYVCKGAPSYNSGSFIDTLNYNSKQTIYIPSDDSTCRITFHFSKKGITVTQIQDNLNFGCGFGHGVFADGYYKKVSRHTPEIIDLLNDDN